MGVVCVSEWSLKWLGVVAGDTEVCQVKPTGVVCDGNRVIFGWVRR